MAYLGECTGEPDVGIAQNKGHAENEGEQNHGIRSESEIGRASVNGSAGTLGRCIAVQCDSRQGNEPSADNQEEDSGPEVVPFGFFDLERLSEA
jgi:hypothetical protein